jgi:hypothetical protein
MKKIKIIENFSKQSNSETSTKSLKVWISLEFFVHLNLDLILFLILLYCKKIKLFLMKIIMD